MYFFSPQTSTLISHIMFLRSLHYFSYAHLSLPLLITIVIIFNSDQLLNSSLVLLSFHDRTHVCRKTAPRPWVYRKIFDWHRYIRFIFRSVCRLNIESSLSFHATGHGRTNHIRDPKSVVSCQPGSRGCVSLTP